MRANPQPRQRRNRPTKIASMQGLMDLTTSMSTISKSTTKTQPNPSRISPNAQKHHEGFFRSSWIAHAPCCGHSAPVAANHDHPAAAAPCTLPMPFNNMPPEAKKKEKRHLRPCAVLFVVGALVGRGVKALTAHLVRTVSYSHFG